jgi:hypothetical protein
MIPMENIQWANACIAFAGGIACGYMLHIAVALILANRKTKQQPMIVAALVADDANMGLFMDMLREVSRLQGVDL